MEPENPVPIQVVTKIINFTVEENLKKVSLKKRRNSCDVNKRLLLN